MFSECSRLWSQIQAKLPGSLSLMQLGLLAGLPGIDQCVDSGFSHPREGQYQQRGPGVCRVSSLRIAGHMADRMADCRILLTFVDY